MAEPVDAIRAIHNAFRNDMEHIDAAAFDSARGKEGLDATVERFRLFNEILVSPPAKKTAESCCTFLVRRHKVRLSAKWSSRARETS